MGIIFSKIKEFFNGKQEYETKSCRGLTDCNRNMVEFHQSITDENCPLHVQKIKKLIQCYNRNHPTAPLQINLNTNELTELLNTEEDLKDLDKASQWLEQQIKKNDPETMETLLENSNYDSENTPLLKNKMIGGVKKQRNKKSIKKTIKQRKSKGKHTKSLRK